MTSEAAETIPVYDEEELSQDEINNMTQDDRFKRLSDYRSRIQNDGVKLSLRAHNNALRILRAVRHKSISDNPHARSNAKKKAEVTKALDLSQFIKPGK